MGPPCTMDTCVLAHFLRVRGQLLEARESLDKPLTVMNLGNMKLGHWSGAVGALEPNLHHSPHHLVLLKVPQ
jgi:hypothetical protein